MKKYFLFIVAVFIFSGCAKTETVLNNNKEDKQIVTKIFYNLKDHESIVVSIASGAFYRRSFDDFDLPYRIKDICLIHNKITHEEKIYLIYGGYAYRYILDTEYVNNYFKYFPNCNDPIYIGGCIISYTVYVVKNVCNECNKARDEFRNKITQLIILNTQ